MHRVVILTTANETTPFAEAIAKAADSERKALGFIARGAYSKACGAGRVFVAVEDRGGGEQTYIGHVLFGGASSELHIHQLFVLKQHRKTGVARRLVDAAAEFAESRNFLGIAVRVAKDLLASKQAWERLGFRFDHSVRGGKSRRRIINLGHRELKTKSLLQFVQGVGQDNVSFSVPPNVGRGTPSYVVDLNVYFDCIKDRGRRPAAQSLFRAAFSTLFRLLRTKEFTRELERHTPVQGMDPILELARAIPEESYDPDDADNQLRAELGRRIFPERFRKGTLTARDKSDIDHLVVTIRSRASGFVTSERALLMQRDWTRKSYGVDILSVEEIVDVLKDAVEAGQAVRKLSAKAQMFEVFDLSKADAVGLSSLQSASGASIGTIQKLNSWSGGGGGHRSVAAKSSGVIVAAAGWRLVSGPPRQIEAVLMVDSTKDVTTSVMDFLLETMVHEASGPSTARIDLSTIQLPDPLQRILLDHGFTRGADAANWIKVAVGRHVGPNQWERVVRDIEGLCGLSLPTTLMQHEFAYGRALKCTMDDGRAWIGSLDDLEGLLSPAILAFSDRPGTLIPIRATFSDELFGHLRQGRLFAAPIASFRRERVYYTSLRSFRLFERGNTLLFYESGSGRGRKMILAAARALGCRTILKTEIPVATLARGVLDKTEIKQLGVRPTVTAISFDNVIMLPRPVTLNQMRVNGWVPGHNFVSATKLPSEVVRQILDMGRP